MTDLKVDANSLYNASYAGMNELAKWATEKEKLISMVLVVREKDGVDKDGNPTTKNYQSVSSASETWFHGAVTDWAQKTLLKRYEKSLEVGAGQTQAYPLIKELFTIEYQDFKKADCFNNVPNNPAPQTGSWN